MGNYWLGFVGVFLIAWMEYIRPKKKDEWVDVDGIEDKNVRLVALNGSRRKKWRLNNGISGSEVGCREFSM